MKKNLYISLLFIALITCGIIVYQVMTDGRDSFTDSTPVDDSNENTDTQVNPSESDKQSEKIDETGEIDHDITGLHDFYYDYTAEPVVALDSFKAEGLPPGNDATYDLSINMEKDGTLAIEANIHVTNLSEDEWNKLAFYFIPNAMTNENKPEWVKDSAQLTIDSVKVNETIANYTLTKGSLLLLAPAQKVKPNSEVEVKISYTYMPAEDGVRLKANNGNYFLAQWYPMLATYQNHQWNAANFDPTGESYLTSYSDFTVNYQLSKPFVVVSSANDLSSKPQTKGTLNFTNAKEFYIAFMKPENVVISETKVNGINLRMLGHPEIEEGIKSQLKNAHDAFTFFSENIGPLPYQQFDIIMTRNVEAMEYPGIVTVSQPNEQFDGEFGKEHTIAHEIAHQWFYNMINNDPYHQPWLDEGVTEYAASLYLLDKYGDEEIAFEFANRVKQFVEGTKANYSLEEYPRGEYTGIAYGIVPTQLWSFFKDHGGIEEAIKFLNQYYNTYQYKQVTSQEFIRFFNSYYKKQYDEFFMKWLRL